MLSGRVVRIWSAVVTAVASAALVGGGVAKLSNAGWLGGDARDYHEEGVLWFAVAAAIMLFALASAIVLTPRRNEWRSRVPAWERAAIIVGTPALTCIAIVAKEALETHFGGLSPFDAQSVLVQHVPSIFAAYALVAPLVAAIVRCSLLLTVGAAEIAIVALVRFLSLPRPPLLPRDFVRACRSRVTRRSLLWSLGLLTFRAPPFQSSISLIDRTVT